MKLAYEYYIEDFIKNLKKKTTVSILDLEKFNEKAFNIQRTIEDLRKSRDNWKNKYNKLKEKNK